MKRNATITIEIVVNGKHRVPVYFEGTGRNKVTVEDGQHLRIDIEADLQFVQPIRPIAPNGKVTDVPS